MSKQNKASVRDDEIIDSKIAGAYGHFLNEGPFIPIYKEAGSERILEGNNNSFIILGRDRDGNSAEGVGGMGGTGCGSIDLVAGLGGVDYKEYIKKLLKKDGFTKKNLSDNVRRTDPSFFKDAARIYITEKGDIDSYLGLAQGNERLLQSQYKSAVGVKADHVRIVGREHIKIVTGKMRLEGGGTHGERNSGGGTIETAGKIDLIAGNYTDPEEPTSILSIFGSKVVGSGKVRKLQPIPKGDNLAELLSRILDAITDVSSMVSNNTRWLQELIPAFQAHVHEITVPFGPTSTPITAGAIVLPTWVQCWNNWIEALVLSFNTVINKVIYLFPFFQTYINSRFVNTT